MELENKFLEIIEAYNIHLNVYFDPPLSSETLESVWKGMWHPHEDSVRDDSCLLKAVKEALPICSGLPIELAAVQSLFHLDTKHGDYAVKGRCQHMELTCISSTGGVPARIAQAGDA